MTRTQTRTSAFCAGLAWVSVMLGAATEGPTRDASAERAAACPPSPASGPTYKYNAAVTWNQAKRVWNGREQTYWWTLVRTAEGMDITMIVGSIGDPEAEEAEKRGIRPPDSSGYKAGKTLSQCNRPGVAQTSELRGGFMYVKAVRGRDPVTGGGQAGIVPWPLYIRTPTVPGGTYSRDQGDQPGEFVLLTVPDENGRVVKESLYRTNQSTTDATKKGDQGSETSDHCVVSEFEGRRFELRAVKKVSPGDTTPRDLSPEDRAFVRDVFSFASGVTFGGEPYKPTCVGGGAEVRPADGPKGEGGVNGN